MTSNTSEGSRAVILGGGGVTGIAWEVGVIRGLLDQGSDLASADALIGTSAGAFAACDIASGVDLEERFALQFIDAKHEIAAAMPPETQAAYGEAITAGLPIAGE